MADWIVFADQDGRSYVALDDEQQQWWRWPAEQDGWRQRRPASAEDADPDREYDAWHARLALRLSGAPDVEG